MSRVLKSRLLHLLLIILLNEDKKIETKLLHIKSMFSTLSYSLSQRGRVTNLSLKERLNSWVDLNSWLWRRTAQQGEKWYTTGGSMSSLFGI